MATLPGQTTYKVHFEYRNKVTGKVETDAWFTEAFTADEAVTRFFNRVNWGVIARHTELEQDSIELVGISCPYTNQRLLPEAWH